MDDISWDDLEATLASDRRPLNYRKQQKQRHQYEQQRQNPYQQEQYERQYQQKHEDAYYQQHAQLKQRQQNSRDVSGSSISSDRLLELQRLASARQRVPTREEYDNHDPYRDAMSTYSDERQRNAQFYSDNSSASAFNRAAADRSPVRIPAVLSHDSDNELDESWNDEV